MGLTPYETERLKTLAAKGGIELDVKFTKEVKLSRKEIKKIEAALSEWGEPLVLVKKSNKPVRVFTHSGHAKLCKGMKEWHKSQGHKTKATVVAAV